MQAIGWDDLGSLPILVGEDGFPGELSAADTSRARTLLQSSAADAVVVAAGAGVFWQIGQSDQQAVQLIGAVAAGGDFALATGDGDGATLPGVPLDWDLLVFVCPHGDTTVLLARYPSTLPNCPSHGVPLALDPGQ